MKTPGFRTGGVGVMRFSAAANHSSLKETIFEPRGAEMRSEIVSLVHLELTAVRLQGVAYLYIET